MNYSVLMSVYYKEKPEYLRQSMDSIFAQSIPTDDFVLVCDGPLNDDLDKVIEEMMAAHADVLKVVMAKEKGIQIPKDWLVDENGVPTDDPSGFPGKSVLQPMAAHKGYGFAVMVEVLASVITGAGLLNEITSWNLDLPSKNKVGHAFIAIDATEMMEKAEYDARMSQVVDSLHKTPRAQGVERIFLPGEMEWDKRAKALENGEIEITDVMAENYKNLAKLYDLQVEIIEG